MNDDPDLSRLTTYVQKVAHEAGRCILEYYAQVASLKPEYKSDATPVTQADRAAGTIIESLLAKHPIWGDETAPILSEEGEIPPFDERKRWKAYWCVDPLDGTREFLGRTDEFCVNIALIRNKKPILGVIYAPVTQEGFCAWHGGGAYRFLNDEREPIQTAKANAPYRVVCSRYGKLEAIEAITQSLGDVSLERHGSATKYGYLASGRADLMFRLSNTSEWDNAAGQCILEEAGGGVLRLNGRPLRYNAKDTLIQTGFFAFGDKNTDWLAHFG